MADRNFEKTLNSLNKGLTLIEGNAVIGLTGAVGTVKGSGITSVTRTGTGAYTIKLEDKYNRYLGGSIGFINASTGSGVASVEVASLTVNDEVADGTGIKIQCYDYAGAAVDPAAASVMGFYAFLRNSTLKGKGE